MKKVLLVVCAVFAAFSLSAFDVMDYVSLKDGVKEYTCTEYSVASKFGDYFKTISGKVTHKIDEAGNDVESTQYSARGVLENVVKTSYDSLGAVMNQAGFNDKDELLWKTENVYKKGSRTEVNDYDAEGNLKNKTILKYEDDLMVDETGYDSKGVLVWKNIYKYDDQKRCMKISQYDAEGKLDSEIGYIYREDGKLESITEIDTVEVSTQKVFRYSTAGILTEVTTYELYESGNKVCERMILKYDDDNNLSKISDYMVSEKFGGIVNELVYMADYTYTF